MKKPLINLAAGSLLCLGVLSTSVSAATRETVIKEQDGSRTTVRTDKAGTQVKVNGTVVYSAGGDRHVEQVQQSIRKGGKVVSDRRKP